MTDVEATQSRRKFLYIGIGVIVVMFLLVVYGMWIYPAQQTQAAVKILEQNGYGIWRPSDGYFQERISPSRLYFKPIGSEWLRSQLNCDPLAYFEQADVLGIEQDSQINESNLIEVFQKLAVSDSLEAVIICRPISDRVLQELPNLNNLKHISIECETISEEGMVALAAIPSLETLALQSNNLPADSLKMISQSRSLQELSFEGMVVSAELLQALKKTKTIREIKLDDDSITPATMKALAEIYTIERIDLYHSNITDAGIAALSSSRSIKILDLCECSEISHQSFEHLANMPQLEQLDFSPAGYTIDYAFEIRKHNEKIKEQVVDSLMRFPSLKRLEIRGLTAINDDNITKLAKIPTLETLNIESTAVTSKGHQQLKKLRPDLEIVR